MKAKVIGQGILVLILAYITVRVLQQQTPYIVHNIDLVMHEAGHTIFFFLGNFMQLFGGTLMQLLVPIVFGLYFVRRQEWFAVGVFVWWLGENLTDVGIYMADARVQMLTLLGGEHDWALILSQLGVMHHDVILGNITRGLGLGMMFFALGWLVYLTWALWRQK